MIQPGGMKSTTPTFINIGPGRCATSWLHEILLAHPEVTMAKVKETEFFNHNYNRGAEWYHEQFPDEGNSVAGEISNCYYTEPSLVERIGSYSPDMKIMINVRDPFSLLQSFHGFGIRRGLNLGPLENSLDVPIGQLMAAGYDYRLQREQLTEGDRIPVLEAVMLSKFIKPVLATFPPENVYLFVFERLNTERAKVIEEMYQFLGVDSSFVPPVAEEVVNPSISPKSKFVARMATRVSYLLRRVGMYGLLSALHQSRLIKKIFYSEVNKTKVPKSNPREVLDADTVASLNQEICTMVELYPPLRKWWSHLLPSDTLSKVSG